MVHLQMVYLLKIVIFHGYVKLPEGSFCFLVEQYVLIMFFKIPEMMTFGKRGEVDGFTHI